MSDDEVSNIEAAAFLGAGLSCILMLFGGSALFLYAAKILVNQFGKPAAAFSVALFGLLLFIPCVLILKKTES